MQKNVSVAERKKTYICFSIIFSILFLFLKLLTLGWYTILFIACIPLYLILYNIAAILTACIKSKTKADHIRFWILSFSFILSGLTFCDFGDTGPTVKIIRFLPDIVLVIICLCSIITCVVLSIISIVFYSKKKKLQNV